MLKRSQFFAPGKMFIAGEYAVTQSGGQALLCPVRYGVKIKLHVRKKFIIRNDQYPEQNQKFFELSEIKDLRIRLTLQIAHELVTFYEKTWTPFSIHITSTLENNGKKYGLGGSGAVVVALLAAILKLHTIAFDAEVLYKLAVKVLWNIEPHASFADVAVSAYQHPIFYQKFDDKVFDYLNFEHSAQLISRSWFGLIIEPWVMPHHLHVVYTGVPALSSTFVREMVSHLDTAFIQASNKLVQEYLHHHQVQALATLQNLILTLGLRANHQLMDAQTTSFVRKLSSNQTIVKYSGAGKGDCLIIVSEQPIDREIVMKNLNKTYTLLEDIIE
jgi:phosphomevalonate kinase